MRSSFPNVLAVHRDTWSKNYAGQIHARGSVPVMMELKRFENRNGQFHFLIENFRRFFEKHNRFEEIKTLLS